MAENRFKARQTERTADQQKTLAKASGAASASTPAEDKTPIQFYTSKEMKKRLRMYCLENDENMTSVIVPLLDEFLKGKGY